jgi:hypothetical protein
MDSFSAASAMTQYYFGSIRDATTGRAEARRRLLQTGVRWACFPTEGIRPNVSLRGLGDTLELGARGLPPC